MCPLVAVLKRRYKRRKDSHVSCLLLMDPGLNRQRIETDVTFPSPVEGCQWAPQDIIKRKEETSPGEAIRIHINLGQRRGREIPRLIESQILIGEDSKGKESYS